MYKKLLTTTAILGFTGLSLYGQHTANQIPIRNTYAITADDSKADIITKAAHVVPSAEQFEALKDEFIAFIHFGPNTFTRMEWGSGKEDPEIFDLKELDTDQWCRTMQEAGMRKVILTVKHHDGFVLWQSRYTDHGIMSTGFQVGKGDILKELAASCKKYGLKLGIYLSPADLYQIENKDGLYGNLSKYTKRTIPRQVEGRPFKNKTRFEFVVDDYNEYFLNQLFELLTEYGPVHEVWFDGAHPKRKGGQKYNYSAWRKLIHTLAPEAVIFGKEDIRWCGNESGATRETEWNVIPYDADPRTLEGFRDLTDADLGSREKLYSAKFLHYQPAETNTSIREGWFYRDEIYQQVRSADDVFDIYERSVGGNSIFLLNIPPNRQGRFSQKDVEVLKEVGRRIKEGYGKNLLEGADGPQALFDGDSETHYIFKDNSIEIVTNAPVQINRVMLQEAIRTNGERIEKHAIDVWKDGKWKQIAEGTNVGYKRILRFPTTQGNRFRLRILKARATPVLSSLGAYLIPVRPPQLRIQRSLDGHIKITPRQHEFGWKPHGHDVLANLHSAFTIYYTQDGTPPTEGSSKYTGEFLPQSNQIRAVAIDAEGNSGPVLQETLGIAKGGWKIIEVSSEQDKTPARGAIDENPATFWHSRADGPVQFIKIDLGAEYLLSGFAYTPQRKSAEGMLAKGNIQVSDDGQSWREAGSFEFGNLINDPSKRKFVFKAKVHARYIMISSEEITGGGNSLSIAEIDFYE